MFNKESFDELLPNQLWDHTVELLPGDHVIDCKMYNLTLDEQKELDEFWDENLRFNITGQSLKSSLQIQTSWHLQNGIFIALRVVKKEGVWLVRFVDKGKCVPHHTSVSCTYCLNCTH